MSQITAFQVTAFQNNAFQISAYDKPGYTTLTNHGPTGPVFTRKRWRSIQDEIEFQERETARKQKEAEAKLRAEKAAERKAAKEARDAELAALFASIEQQMQSQLVRSGQQAASQAGNFQDTFRASQIDAIRAQAAARAHLEMIARQKQQYDDDQRAIQMLMGK